MYGAGFVKGAFFIDFYRILIKIFLKEA